MKAIFVEEDTLPAAWEEAVLRTWNEGSRFPTEYDKPGNPLSRDVTAMVTVKCPLENPRIHRSICHGLDDLEKYRNEVVIGVHNHFMDDLENPERWEYTYNDRMFNYEPQGYGRTGGINQVEECIEMLKKTPHSRRAKIGIWNVEEDLATHDHPPCLQYLWLRVESVPYEDGTIDRLNMNAHIRSNDAFKAAFSNWWAVTELQAYIAEQIGVEMGAFTWIADSFHIYGSYFDEFEGFLKSVETRDYKDRVYSTEFANEFFIEGCDQLLREENMTEDKIELIKQRKQYLESII